MVSKFLFQWSYHVGLFAHIRNTGCSKSHAPSLTHYILRYENSIALKEVCLDFETPKSTGTDPSSMFLYIFNLSILIRINRLGGHHGIMFGITKNVKGYSILTYFVYCYAIFIS